MEATLLTQPRSILVRLTVDEDGELLVTNANGLPKLIKSERAHKQLVDMCRDLSVPEARTEAEGFSIGETLKGAAKFFADMNKPDGGGT